MKKILTSVVAFVGITGASAQSLSPAAALERLVRATTPQSEWFAPTFLAQVPLAQLQAALPSLTANLGAFVRVAPDGAGFRVEYERGFIPAQLALNAGGQIVGLFFQAPQRTGQTLQGALAEFRALPGQVSVLVLEGTAERAALNPDARLAVGSAFKLAVLAELQAQVSAGTRRWDEVVTLTAADKSLPSGVLQDWPTGSRLTLETLATLMISISDNTATDVLLRLVGRPGVERRLGQIAMPNTREAFALKNPANVAIRNRYLRGAEAEKRAALRAANTAPMPSAELFSGGPVSPEVEWFVNARTLCGLVRETAGLPLTRVNPGLARAQDWASVSYKGGSEPGVLNFTTLVAARDGKTYCVSATWNHTAALDETKFASLYGGLLSALR